MTGKDIQARLRDPRYIGQEGIRNEAADALDAQAATIARLERELGEAREALKPFALEANDLRVNTKDTQMIKFYVSAGAIRRAARTLGASS